MSAPTSTTVADPPPPGAFDIPVPPLALPCEMVSSSSDSTSENESPAADRKAFLTYAPPLTKDAGRIWDYANSDDGRATCFLDHFSTILRYCPEINRWRVWHGHRWHDDTTGRVGHYCQLLGRHEIEAALAFLDKHDGDEEAEKQGRAFEKQAERLGNEATIKALLLAATRSPAVVVTLESWDANPWLVGLTNGVLDLRTRQMHSGRPEDLMTKALNVAFDPDALCPRWEAFIARILPGALGEYVQRLAGYSLTGNMDDGAFYFCHGSGKNGKSILMMTLAHIFGDYAGVARADLFEEPKHGGSAKHDLAGLPGIRFLHGEETTDGARLRAGTLKSLATGETMTGEKKYCDPFSFRPQCKLWIGGNHKPRLDGADFGLVRRLRLIPFTQTITEAEEVPREELLAALRDEAPGILNWLLKGLAAWKPGMRHASIEVREASTEYAKSEDEVGDFIENCTQDADDDYRGTTKAVAYDAYCRWAALEGNKHPLGLKAFTRRLGAKGWALDAGRRHWRKKSIKREDDWGSASDCAIA